jgi:hypothetical protein
MSTKKKVTPKAPEAKAKYNISGKVFFINYAGSKAEILEGQIESIQSTKFPEKDNLGKIRGYSTLFDYDVTTKRGGMLVSEFNLFPSYQAAASEFGKSFLLLLK